MKILSLFFKLIAALILLVVVVLAVFLVPPHLQVGKVNPPLPEMSELEALMSVPDGPVLMSYVNTSTQDRDEGRLGHTVFLAEWPDGSTFMIDAGMDLEQAAEFAALLDKIGSGGEVHIHGTLPEIIGNDIGRVTGVGFTHLHIDHTQGIVPFCRMRGRGAALYQTSFQRDLQNFNTKEGAALIGASCLAEGSLAGDALQTTNVYPGLGIFTAGGHTPGSTVFVLAIGGHLWVLAGDITNNKADLLANRGKGFVYSTLLVPENTKRLGQLRQWLAELDAREDATVIISHDIDDIKASGMTEFAP